MGNMFKIKHAVIDTTFIPHANIITVKQSELRSLMILTIHLRCNYVHVA